MATWWQMLWAAFPAHYLTQIFNVQVTLNDTFEFDT